MNANQIMFEFYGCISQQNKQYINDQVTKGVLAFTSIFLCVLFIPIIIASITIHWTFLLLIILLLLLLPIVKFSKNEGVHPICIRISQDMIEMESEQYIFIQKELYKVKKILDCGSHYIFCFSFPFLSKSFLCQKDLLTAGTIEDFEKCFEGQIVRKGKRVAKIDK